MESTTTTIETCANCGKEGGDSLKACTACFMVKYCNRDCQIAHRKQHKKECKKRAAELHDEKLFEEVENEDCPICFLPLPLDIGHTQFQSCCGKIICAGCVYAIKISEGKDLCAFCRIPPPRSHEEDHERLKKHIKSGNAEAFSQLSGYYARGTDGMPQDRQKANELCIKAGELGCANAYYNLGVNYDTGTGVEIDKKRAIHYFELAAMMGHVWARHNLGCLEGFNYDRAKKHFAVAARAGYKESLDAIKQMFMNELVTKDEYAHILRAYHERQKEMKSDAREKAAMLIDRQEMI